MPKNVGQIDRLVRALLGLALIILAATGTIGPCGYIGIVPMLTAVLRTCPAYTDLGINTCKTKTRSGCGARRRLKYPPGQMHLGRGCDMLAWLKTTWRHTPMPIPKT